MRLRYVEEPEPLGTGGALKFADEPMLDERFLMLNGDVLTDLDLQRPDRAARGDRARARRSRSCRSRTRRAYGLVRTRRATARSREFVEKPAPDQIDTNHISAGAYVLERSVLDLLEPESNASIEREVFPQLVGDGPLRLRRARATGSTSGRPSATCRARSTSSRAPSHGGRASACDALLGVGRRRRREGRIIPPGAGRARRADRAEGARRRAAAVLGAASRSGRARRSSARWCSTGARSARDCTLRGCIVGAGVGIGDDCTIEGMSVLGEGVTHRRRTTSSSAARGIFPRRRAARRRDRVLRESRQPSTLDAH